MIDYREILKLKSLGYTMKYIASSVHSSRNIVSEVLTLAAIFMFVGRLMNGRGVLYERKVIEQENIWKIIK